MDNFAEEQRAKSQALHAGLERAEDVAVGGKNAAWEPNLDSVRLLSGMIPSLGEFYLAARAGAATGQPNVALGAYGALSAPEFTKEGVEKSVMSSILFGRMGEFSQGAGRTLGLGKLPARFAASVATGAGTYAIARESGASPTKRPVTRFSSASALSSMTCRARRGRI
jgi:hypothetical protein